MGGYVRIIFWQKEKNGGDNFLEISGLGVFFIHWGKIYGEMTLKSRNCYGKRCP